MVSASSTGVLIICLCKTDRICPIHLSACALVISHDLANFLVGWPFWSKFLANSKHFVFHTTALLRSSVFVQLRRFRCHQFYRCICSHLSFSLLRSECCFSCTLLCCIIFCISAHATSKFCLLFGAPREDHRVGLEILPCVSSPDITCGRSYPSRRRLLGDKWVFACSLCSAVIEQALSS